MATIVACITIQLKAKIIKLNERFLGSYRYVVVFKCYHASYLSQGLKTSFLLCLMSMKLLSEQRLTSVWVPDVKCR